MSTDTRCTEKEAAELVTVLMGCYRRGEVESPEIFVRAAIAMFRTFPFSACRAVVDPVKGLPSKLKWLPSIAEIREALDAEIAPSLRMAERENARRQAAPLLAAPVVTAEQRERAVARWEAMRVGFARVKSQATDKAEAIAKLRAMGMSDEDFAAIPDAKSGAWRKVGDAT